MWFAHFECVLSRKNACRFYRYEIVPGLLGGWLLECSWGRIGSIGSRRQLEYGEELGHFCEKLRAEARERFQHGYCLTETNLPTAMAGQLDSVRVAMIPDTKIMERRSEKLKKARAVVAQLPGSAESTKAIDRVIERLDPENRRAANNVGRGPARPDCADLFEEPTSCVVQFDERLEADEVVVCREVFRNLAKHLLDDDPIVYRGILGSLNQTLPFEPDQSNVVPMRVAGSRLDRWSIDQFIFQARMLREDPPRLGYERLTRRLADRLRDAGVRTLADLLMADARGLVRSKALSEADLKALTRALTDYGLRLKTTEAEETRAPALTREMA